MVPRDCPTSGPIGTRGTRPCNARPGVRKISYVATLSRRVRSVSIDSDWGLYSGTNDWPNPAWARRPCGRSTIHEIEELLPWHAGTLLRPRKRRRPEGLAAIRCPVSHGTDGQPRTPREATRKALIAHVNLAGRRWPEKGWSNETCPTSVPLGHVGHAHASRPTPFMTGSRAGVQ